MDNTKISNRSKNSLKASDSGSGTMNISLGRKLKNVLVEYKQGHVNTVETLRPSDLERVRKEKAQLEEFIQLVIHELVLQIEHERIPCYVIDTHNFQSWVLDAVEDNAKYQELWYGFIDFMFSNDLQVNVVEVKANEFSSVKVEIRLEPVDALEDIVVRLQAYEDGTPKTYFPGKPWLNRFGFPHRVNKCSSCDKWECEHI